MNDTIREFMTTSGAWVAIKRKHVASVAMHGTNDGVTIISLETGAFHHVKADYNEVMAWWRGEEAK